MKPRPKTALPTRSSSKEVMIRSGVDAPLQDSPLTVLLSFTKKHRFESPRANLLEIYKSGVVDAHLGETNLNNDGFRRGLIHDALQCLLDLRSGGGSAWFDRDVRSDELEFAEHMVWDGIQNILAHLAGGNLNLVTQYLNEVTEETLSFITKNPQWVEARHARKYNLRYKGEEPKPLEPSASIPPNLLAVSEDQVKDGATVVMQAPQAPREPITWTDPHDGMVYVQTEPMLPRAMQPMDEQYIITTVTNTLTRGPLVRALLIPLKEGEAKQSAQLQPVWRTLVTALRKAEQGPIGNWLANVVSEEKVPRAGRMIIQWASSMINATRMAEEVVSVAQPADIKSDISTPMDGIINSLFAQTEYFPKSLIQEGNEAEGAQVMREFIMQIYTQVGRAGVLEMLASVIGHTNVEGKGGEWLKELSKFLRDEGYYNESQTTKTEAAGNPLGHVFMTHMQTEATPIPASADLRTTLSSALCGTVATYPQDGQKEGNGIVRMDLPAILLLQSRKAKTPGRPVLMMTENTTTPAQRERIEEFLLNQSDIIGAAIGHADKVDRAISRGDSLSVQQRVATMVTMWAHTLSERTTEPMDYLKEQARGRLIGALISWHLSGHSSEIVSNSIEQALRIIGLRWSESSIQNAVQQVISRGPTDGPNTRKKVKKLATILGVIHPDLTLSLGKAPKVMAVAAIEGKSTVAKKNAHAAMEIQEGDVFTHARRLIVEAEKLFLENIAQGTQQLASPEAGRAMRETIIGSFSSLNLIYEIGVLAKDGSPEAMVALAHALRAYNETAGIIDSAETAPYNAAIEHIIEAARNAGVRYELPHVRMGKDTMYNVGNLPDMGGKDITLNAADRKRLREYGTHVFQFASTYLGDSFDIVAGFANAEEKQDIGQVVGAQLKKQLAYLLENQHNPHSYHKLVSALGQRIAEIEERVQTVSNNVAGAASIFTIGQTFEQTFKEKVAGLGTQEAAKLIKVATRQEKKLRGELDAEIAKIFSNSKTAVTQLGKDRLFLAKEIMSTVLSPLGVSPSGKQVGELMGMFKASTPTNGTPDELGTVLMQALSMFGAGGLGYAVGASKGGGAGLAGAQLANTLQAETATLSAAQGRVYHEAATLKNQEVMESLRNVYGSRLEYYRQMMEAAQQVEATTIFEGLRLENETLIKQYAHVEKAIEGVFALTGKLVDIRIQGIGLDVEEAQKVFDYISQFMHVMRPSIRKMITMAKEQWDLDIEAGMPGWDEQQMVLGIKAIDVKSNDEVQIAAQ